MSAGCNSHVLNAVYIKSLGTLCVLCNPWGNKGFTEEEFHLIHATPRGKQENSHPKVEGTVE